MPHQQERDFQRVQHLQGNHLHGGGGKRRSDNARRHDHPGNQQRVFAPMRLMIHGEQNMMIALQISRCGGETKGAGPSCGVAKKVLKKVANCWSKTSYTQATPITYRMNIHMRWRNRLNTVLAVICRWFAPGVHDLRRLVGLRFRDHQQQHQQQRRRRSHPENIRRIDAEQDAAR